MSPFLTSLADIQLLRVNTVVDERGVLNVFQAGIDLPIVIARVFAVTAEPGTTRGFHAHMKCTQALVCLHGAVDLVCDDGESRKTLRLKDGGSCLVIPPGIWCEQIYLKPRSILMALCDRPFEAEDYIRDHQEFLNWRSAAGK